VEQRNTGPEFASNIPSILAKNGITDEIADVSISEAVELVGRQFGSFPYYITVTFKGKREKLHLFYKKTIAIPAESAEMWKIMTMKEEVILLQVFPEINDFMQRTSGLQGFLLPYVPKAYYSDKGGVLMENLKEGGYALHNKNEKHGHSAAVAMMRTLGKFHGASWAWANEFGSEDKVKEKHPEMFKEMLDSEDGLRFMETTMGSPFKCILSLIQTGSGLRSDTTLSLEKFGKYADPNSCVMRDALKILKSKTHFRALSHSDCFTNNIMFKLDFSSVKILDFQFVRYNCPLIDVAVYLASCAKSSVLKEWKSLFNIYYQVVKETVELSGQRFPFTLHDLLEDFVIVQDFGIHYGIVIPLVLACLGSYDLREKNEGCDADVIYSLMKKWIAENPKEAKVLAEESVGMINDFAAIQPYND